MVPTAAVWFSSRQQEEYTASASLLFRDSGEKLIASQNPEREAATNVRLLESGVLQDRLKKKYGSAVAGDIKVIAEGEANLITIEATSTEPRTAARLANETTRSYIAFRRRVLRDEIRDEQRRVRAQLAAVPKLGPGATARRKSLRRRLRQLEIDSKIVTSDVRRVGRAEPPTSASSPDPARAGVIGAGIGLALGLLLALALDRLDLRVRDPRRFEDAFGRPIIGKIPKSRALAKLPPGGELPPVEGQAFRDLRANLRHFLDDQDRLVVVVSAQPREGKTTIAWNLARAATVPHSRVLVVEADLRRPGLSAKLGTNGTPGLSDLLAGRASIHDAVREVQVPTGHNGTAELHTVDVLFAGSTPHDPTGLLESNRMRRFLEKAGRQYDLVVIDTPPTSVASDAIPVMAQASGVIVVGRLSKSRQEPVAELAKRLRELSAPTLGVVVNSTTVPSDTYHYYRKAET